MQQVNLASLSIGQGSPPVFLAEIGALFNRDIDLAERLIDEIAATALGGGLPLILKGEVLHDATICLDDATVETYQSKTSERRQERYRDLIERKTLSLRQYADILKRAHALDLIVVMSIYDFVGANFAKEHGVAALKIASSNITHLPLIRHSARLGLPLIIDDGRASFAEVERAVTTARDAGCEQIILQHSPDGHPAIPKNHNLRSLVTLKERFGVPTGLSDHSSGEDAMLVALGLDVDLLEKNIVVDDQRLEQDYAIAMPIRRLGDMLKRLDDAWLALGRSWRDIAVTDGLIATSARMGVLTATPVRAGETISLDKLHFAFPKKGMGAEDFDKINGRKFATDLDAGEILVWDHVRD